MGKKIKFPFLSNAKNNIVRQPKSSWQWPSCHQPRTLSFRTDNNTTLFKTINSAYLDAIIIADENETPPSDDCLETVIRGLRSDRLFFKPESVVLSMESRDPYVDFRESMEEMVEAQGLNDWEELEQLLCWYLKANGKCNHGFIIDCSSATINEAVKEIDDNSCHCLFEADNKKEMIIIEGNEEDDASSLLDDSESNVL
ncbi:hypothetical protein GOBAR_AA35523 [Gossypium barbadense]|uniref:Transcription repressor n=1 Tax=Gossypium barbadense TaxID=3634 RepID=A0A2P5W249_GOSBA|nr:hypothetical protein GOBAR_AA35523 [Gossypium barbadense]